MKKISTHIDGLFVVKREIFSDDRGFFMELWNHNVFKNTNLNFNFTQNNVSKSKKNVIRGSVLDIVVDIRRKSKTFGSYFSIELLENKPVSLWIPPGCAHGLHVPAVLGSFPPPSVCGVRAVCGRGAGVVVRA